MNSIDMAVPGKKYRMLTLIREERMEPSRNRGWVCHCDCGKETKQSEYNIVRGIVVSCGCHKNRMSGLRGHLHNRRHGMTSSAAYSVWRHMRARCEDRAHKSYSRYGARGIAVCDRWEKFENFLSDMGMPPPGMSIERIDNDGDYCKENCRWATPSEQANNTSNTRRFTIDGVTRTATEWSKSPVCKVRYDTFMARVRDGWDPSDALTIAARKKSPARVMEVVK